MPVSAPPDYCPHPSCRGTGSIKADVLQAKFDELLRTIEPKPSAIKLMKEVIKRQTLKEHGNINQDLSEVRDKLDGIAITRPRQLKVL